MGGTTVTPGVAIQRVTAIIWENNNDGSKFGGIFLNIEIAWLYCGEVVSAPAVRCIMIIKINTGDSQDSCDSSILTYRLAG